MKRRVHGSTGAASSRAQTINAVGTQRRNRTTATRPRARDHGVVITIAIGTPRRNCTTATSNNYNVSAVTQRFSYDVKKGNRYGVSAAVNS